MLVRDAVVVHLDASGAGAFVAEVEAQEREVAVRPFLRAERLHEELGLFRGQDEPLQIAAVGGEGRAGRRRHLGRSSGVVSERGPVGESVVDLRARRFDDDALRESIRVLHGSSLRF